MPATSPLTNLIALVPRLEKLEELQRRQDAEVAELRARSARVVENWYEWGVLGMGECWGEWEGRLERAEGRCRKEEKRRKEEEESRIFGDVDGEEKGGFLKETGDGGG